MVSIVHVFVVCRILCLFICLHVVHALCEGSVVVCKEVREPSFCH